MQIALALAGVIIIVRGWEVRSRTSHPVTTPVPFGLLTLEKTESGYLVGMVCNTSTPTAEVEILTNLYHRRWSGVQTKEQKVGSRS